MSKAIVHGAPLLEALGIPAEGVRKATIVLEYGKAPTVVVERIGRLDIESQAFQQVTNSYALRPLCPTAHANAPAPGRRSTHGG